VIQEYSLHHFQVPRVLVLIVDGNRFQPEWLRLGSIAFLMKKESSLLGAYYFSMPIQSFWITEINAWMYSSGDQYSYPDLFKSPLDLITGRGLESPSSYHCLLKGEISIRRF
jgi:hypothetical protein